MRKTIFILTVTAAILGMVNFACRQSAAKEKNEETVLAGTELVRRGEYLVNSIGCDDCHSPKKMGAHGPEIIPELRLSGYPAGRPVVPADSQVVKQGWSLFGPDFTSTAGMWGMSFAANLTSDPTGIGNWTEEQFIRAIREGKFKGHENGRDLLPPMPWFVYRNMNDTDLKAILAYLKTTKPVENVVPAPIPFSALK